MPGGRRGGKQGVKNNFETYRNDLGLGGGKPPRTKGTAQYRNPDIMTERVNKSANQTGPNVDMRASRNNQPSRSSTSNRQAVKSRYKTPGVVDHPERLAARKRAAARTKQATPGVIDHPANYRKVHPNAILRSLGGGKAEVIGRRKGNQRLLDYSKTKQGRKAMRVQKPPKQPTGVMYSRRAQ